MAASPWESEMVTNPRDRQRLKAIFDISSEFLSHRQYEGSMCEDRVEHTYLIRFSNILTVDDPIDLFMLMHVVEQCKPMVKECIVQWDMTTASHLSIEIVLLKEEGIEPSAAGIPIYDPFYPDIKVDLKKHLTDSKFEMRHTPSSWSTIFPKLETLSRAMYTRGDDIATPALTLNVGSIDTVVLDFANTERLTYSFLEYVTSKVGIVGLEARGKEFTLSFCVDSTPGHQFPSRQ